MRKFIVLFLLIVFVNATPTIDERLKWLENTVVHIQKLKGIPGEVGMQGAQGPPGKCDDAARMQAQIANLYDDLAKVAIFVILLAVYVIFWK